MTQAQTAKTNLLGLSPDKLAAFFESLGEKRFRAVQVLKWIHQNGVDDFSQMTNISKVLREKLAQVAEVRAPEVLGQWDSADGTRKWLIRVEGGNAIETVYIPDGDRGTLCVSSQVGCSLDCSFCATGKQGFNRDLSAAEIIGQVWIACKSFGQLQPKGPRKVTNVVMMGMGEPLLNFDNVVDAMTLMMEDNAYGISKRRVTLSTSGVVPALDRLADVTDVSLAISLHAPNDELRNQLVPINKKYPIAMLLDSAQRYIERMPDSHRKITIEYTLIREVNDRPEHAEQLAELLRDVPVKINLIPFNPFELSDYERVSNNALRRFQQILLDKGYTVTVRTTRGDDIAAACGQLAGSVNDRTRRSERYRNARLRDDGADQGEIESPVRFVG
ncbi:23S rRNA (adenine(2503)-C(2))-methyltransferase RlmN [Microbulbifer thermotolerans]|uniref:Dual-specificity RNA methyltransferase RlmN n=1 Tax=Microbulbifer thermotolerans TaxID=252514 RepID=A0A143HP85_MICTH|nr:23S rRNA (adenine(2503)-C(2))-methyltransferase RlmN [Microbulbifer thermotolerans]AMX03092.1 23S rRNA (adenine(2503)-C(2))-methyltransferase RlmN [Microbulbifer thermotolerans]MCX2779058.1 23S rRNA (adenine(2503)-C(2))-methyltransferase RlmN [Microbulbifer thermotolerans]MCX2784365.1 23S rRNA (adenine(2503)-C(2))-methyltransferase RlmN [Microbulbifer thermotolerans]MCX2796003.1 23S rRNA (adenine(2503)-C(2))-methyltransferase RlmN [Microbulbifer thermotolerans]MCX2801892.1 23S rRNA (adenine